MARNRDSNRRDSRRRRRQRGGSPRTAAIPSTPRPTRGSPTPSSSDAADAAGGAEAEASRAQTSTLPARPRREIRAQRPTTEDSPRVQGLLYRLTHPRWLIAIIDELRKVVWPSRQETGNLTVVVLVVSIAVGIFLGVIDFGFNQVVDQVLLPE